MGIGTMGLAMSRNLLWAGQAVTAGFPTDFMLKNLRPVARTAPVGEALG